MGHLCHVICQHDNSTFDINCNRVHAIVVWVYQQLNNIFRLNYSNRKLGKETLSWLTHRANWPHVPFTFQQRKKKNSIYLSIIIIIPFFFSLHHFFFPIIFFSSPSFLFFPHNFFLSHIISIFINHVVYFFFFLRHWKKSFTKYLDKPKYAYTYLRFWYDDYSDWRAEPRLSSGEKESVFRFALLYSPLCR